MKKIIFSLFALMLIASESYAANARRPIDPGYNDPAGNIPPVSRRSSVPSIYAPANSSPLKSQIYLSLEYSAPRLSHDHGSNDFKTNSLEKQLKDIENIAIGLNWRPHKFLGFNANWAQTELRSNKIYNASSLQEGHLNIDQYNFSALFYLPVVKNLFDVFAEVGTSVMFSNLRYFDASQNLVSKNSSRAAALYGLGFQVAPFADSRSLIRFSAQKYSGSVLSGNDYATFRVGYLMAF